MKRILIIALLLLSFTLIFSSCGGSTVNVKFFVDGQSYHTATMTEDGIEMPKNPQKEGYSFDGWYYDNDTFEDPFDKTTLLTKGVSEVSVYAKWTEKRPYERVDEDTISFGSYPQTEVTDEQMKAALNSLGSTLPTSDNAQSWTSYGYYLNGTDKSFMWYKDVEKDGERYRGVYFTSFRPSYVNSTSGSSYQGVNGYQASTVYWFKYEPISWTILEETDNKAMILCDMIIDAQNYFTDVKSYKENGKDVYANNYELSTIRAWLNDCFYNTAFDELQKELILTTNVHNRKDRTDNPKSNKYACEDTKDKVFLLSYSGAKSLFEKIEQRQKKVTNYAKAQGAYTYPDASIASGYWWLRSPSSHDSYAVSGVYPSGNLSYGNVADSSYGVVPSLWLKLN